MIKKIIVVLVLSNFLLANTLNYALSNKHSFVLPKGSLELTSSYLKVNDTLDIFNVKEKELGNLARFGAIGDMDGFELGARYGLTKKDSIFVNYQQWNVDYAGSVLKNSRFEFFNRYNLLNTPYSFFQALSFDVGYINNSADNLDVKNEAMLNSMLKKIKPNSGFSFKNGSIVADGTTITLQESPFFSIEDMQSDSYYVRLLLGRKMSSHSVFDIYATYEYSDIKTKLDFSPKDNIFINQIAGNFNLPVLDRDEKKMHLGFNYTLENSNIIYDFNYEFSKIYRDDSLSVEDTNHVFDVSVSRILNKNWIIFVGGKLMLNQFNTDLPYLYNKYTQTQFDKKYGFAKIGLIYKFKPFK